MKRVATSMGVILAATALASCGSDDGGDRPGAAPDGSPSKTAAPSAESCAESFNADAPDDFALLIRLSHADGAAVLTGRYTGDPFTAEAFDATTDGTGVDATVEAGACVVTEASDLGTLYVFAVGDDAAWHRFGESDPEVPLRTDPAAQLADLTEVTLAEGQTSDSPDLVPVGS